MIYYHLRYKDKLSSGMGGWSWLWFIRIDKRYKGDRGLLEHEIEHVHQCYRLWFITALIGLIGGLILSNVWTFVILGLGGMFTHSFLYTFIKEYRLWSEVKAYRKQLKVRSYRSPLFAIDLLTTKYGLDISRDMAGKLLGVYK